MNFLLLASLLLPFSLPLMNGEGGVFKSAVHPKAVFVFEAFFLACPYCNDNAPNVDELASRLEGQNVVVADLGIDRQDSQYAEWVHRHNPNHPVLKDSGRELISQLGTTSYPSTYVVDCNGLVVMKTSGVWSKSKLSDLEAKAKEAAISCSADLSNL